MRIKSKATIDDNIYINKYLYDIADILSTFGKLEYRVYGKYKKTSISKISNRTTNSEYYYLEVPLEFNQ